MTVTTAPHTATAHPSTGLAGSLAVPGDKSISHRALMIAALAVGETTIHGLLEGADVLATADALRQLGVTIEKAADGSWRVTGVGVGGLNTPDRPIDFGNSGTGTRLMMGLLASHPVSASLSGDASLSARPMGRVIEPLEAMGARFHAGTPGHLPLDLDGARSPLPVRYRVPVPSAQVKSAILLATLNTPGATTVIEAAPTRDHTERMLRNFGARIDIAHETDGCHITVHGPAELHARDIRVPGDPSSAAFPLVAALITPGSQVTLDGVLMNPTRTGLITTLREMGADITETGRRDSGGEQIADIEVRSSRLTGVTVPAGRAPSMIDEYPALAVAAAFADGDTVMAGLGELRVKETDRLAAIAAGLDVCGVTAEVSGDDLTVSGGRGVPGGGHVAAHMDHRIAMAFLVLGLGAREPVGCDGANMIQTSFPGFFDAMGEIGADITLDGGEHP